VFQFEQPNAEMTLREGLAELNAAYNQGQNINTQVSQAAQTVLTAHDCVHVIFGCNISYKGEALNQAWTFWGTDSSKYNMKELVGDEHLKIALQYLNIQNLIGNILAIPQIFKVYRQSKHMPERFPWLGYQTYMDCSISQIRSEFGITLVAATK
jgi:hypothetical protein